MTALDRMTEKFGVPSCAKIDAKGLESQVIRVLSRLMEWPSYKFAPERRVGNIACIEQLLAHGPIEPNCFPRKAMRMALRDCVSRKSWKSTSEYAMGMRTYLATRTFGPPTPRSAVWLPNIRSADPL